MGLYPFVWVTLGGLLGFTALGVFHLEHRMIVHLQVVKVKARPVGRALPTVFINWWFCPIPAAQEDGRRTKIRIRLPGFKY